MTTTTLLPETTSPDERVGLNLVILQGKIVWLTRYEKSEHTRLTLSVRDVYGKVGTYSVVLRKRQMRDLNDRLVQLVEDAPDDEYRRKLREIQGAALKGLWVSITGRLESHVEHGKYRIDIMALEVEVLNEPQDYHHSGGNSADAGPGSARRGG